MTALAQGTAEIVTVDRYLAEMDALARSTLPAVRWHRFGQTAIVAGPTTADFVDAERAAAQDVLIFERPIGGGPVLVTPEHLALAIALPIDHPLWHADVTESYAWLGQALFRASASLGIPARIVSVAEARAQDPLFGRIACFASCSPYEVFVGDGKLWGLAQRRTRTTALLVAGAYLAGEPASLAGLLRGPVEHLALIRERLSAVATLERVTPHGSALDLIGAVQRQLALSGLPRRAAVG